MLAILLPHEVFFITLKDQVVCPMVNKAYSCLAWSPSTKSKGMMLAASSHSIDLLDVHTGGIMKSFQNIFDDKSASGKGRRYLLVNLNCFKSIHLYHLRF